MNQGHPRPQTLTGSPESLLCAIAPNGSDAPGSPWPNRQAETPPFP